MLIATFPSPTLQISHAIHESVQEKKWGGNAKKKKMFLTELSNDLNLLPQN